MTYPASIEQENQAYTIGELWSSRLEHCDFAFQPIVNIHTGICYGCEALLRNHISAGFPTIQSLFDNACRENILYPIDLVLREKAVSKFSICKWDHRVILFFNIDNRVLEDVNYRSGNTLNIIKRNGLSQGSICFEITEKYEMANFKQSVIILNQYRDQGIKIAVDDCGTGFANLKLLYYTRPDFIKIDRFFIQDIANDPNKRLFVRSIVNIAHLMGGLVVAEGVETQQEYFSCMDIGCDLIQGNLIQLPEIDITKLKNQYEHIRQLGASVQRDRIYNDKKLILSEIMNIEPVLDHADVRVVFEKFKNNQQFSFLPVINDDEEPVGVITEKCLKDYAYSRYGYELLQNPLYGKNLRRFIQKYPIADIHTRVEKILEIYSLNDNIEGIIIVENMKYKGFLRSHSLLKLLNEKNISAARDQNPLTKLPGNTMIYEYVSHALQDIDTNYFLVYFDFDNFKPFNDTYGFRNGDRVILRFAEILKARDQSYNNFIGHIGGDDFFLGIKGGVLQKIKYQISEIIFQFKSDAESFYDPEAIAKGYIEAKDRQGHMTRFPLLGVSAVIIELPAQRQKNYTVDEVSTIIAEHKHYAKIDPSKISIYSLKFYSPFILEYLFDSPTFSMIRN